ncbi:MAG: alpha/beta hydrolase [Gemmatimonadetes bacterium]|nr:alpha/beta hydrolase [Gemmatimonadota bacterium]
MFVVTNRVVKEKARTLNAVGAAPNENGPNEIRFMRANKVRGNWQIQILPDVLNDDWKKDGGITDPDPVYASRYVGKALFEELEKKKKNLLVFVHGFNNDLAAAVERAHGFQTAFKTEVLTFSWPANGGGAKGVTSYKDDKRDARISGGALDRVFETLQTWVNDYRRSKAGTWAKEARKKFPRDKAAQQQYVKERRAKGAPFSINLVLHSMGNYLYKQVLSSSIYRAGPMLFDNVVLVAADANNEDHPAWIDRIAVRNRIYITINEDDSALLASRMQGGEEQKARLGHYLYDLHSRRAVYVDFTDAPQVLDSHSYFEGRAIQNGKIKRFFQQAFNGERAEANLKFDEGKNLYRIV